MDRLLRTLCTRGVREKFLSKHLQKNKDIINTILNPDLLSSFGTTIQDQFKSTTDESFVEHSSTTNKETRQEPSTEEVNMDTDVKTDSNGVKSEMKECGGSVVVNGGSTSQDVNDPTFPAYCLEALLVVVEYLEGMQSRLITAQLHNEVCVLCCDSMCITEVYVTDGVCVYL